MVREANDGILKNVLWLYGKYLISAGWRDDKKEQKIYARMKTSA